MSLSCGCPFEPGKPVPQETLIAHYIHTFEAIMFWELLTQTPQAIPTESSLGKARISYLAALDEKFPVEMEAYPIPAPGGRWNYMGGKDNPMVAMTIHFQDGASLKQIFSKPISQADAMLMLGAVVARLDSELDLTLPGPTIAAAEYPLHILYTPLPTLEEMTGWIEEFFITQLPPLENFANVDVREWSSEELARFLISKLEGVK